MVNRCSICKKKLPLITITCKCDSKLMFCSKHLHDHNCKYDYLKENIENLKKENPIIVPDKIDNI